MALACAAVKEALVMDDESLENIVAVALQRIRASLERGTPFMAQRVRTWMESLWPGHQLEEYWTHPISFPRSKAVFASPGFVVNIQTLMNNMTLAGAGAATHN
jgi:hypothetical protein